MLGNGEREMKKIARRLCVAALLAVAAFVSERTLDAGTISCREAVNQCMAHGGNPDPGECQNGLCYFSCHGGVNPLTNIVCS